VPTITVKVSRPLAERLAAEDGATEGSCFDLTSDLAGSVRGPSDLSFNRRRLKGYGR
jgi:hypothetical protein